MTLLNCHTLLTGWLILPCRSAEAGCCSWSAAADWSRQSCVPLPSCGMSCDSHIRSLSSHVTAHCVVAVRSCDHHMSAVKSCDSHVIAIWSHGNTFCNSCQHVTVMWPLPKHVTFLWHTSHGTHGSYCSLSYRSLQQASAMKLPHTVSLL